MRGLKYLAMNAPVMLLSRTPHGVRGLKFRAEDVAGQPVVSHPAWGAWIEMPRTYQSLLYLNVAPRMGCVD